MPTLAAERRITIYLSVDVLKAIDAFREHALGSRAAAVTALIRRGAAAKADDNAPD